MSETAADFAPPNETASLHLLPLGLRGKLAIVVLMSSAPAMALMFGALGPILPMIAAHFSSQGDGTFLAQLVMTMPAIGVIIGGLVGGLLIERFGLRPVLLAALLTYALAGAAGLVIDDIWALLASRFIVGIAVANLSTAIMLLVGGWFDGLARARLLGLQATCAGVASVTALFLSGALARRFGWHAPFAVYFAALAVLGIAIVAIPRGVAAATENAQRIDWTLLRGLWPIYALQIPLFIAYFMTSVQFSFLLAADGVSDALVRALLIATGVAAGGVSAGFYGRLFAKAGARWMPLIVMALMAIGFLIIGSMTSLAMIGFGCALAGAGGGLISPHIGGRLLARAPLSVRPRALGFSFTAIYAADFLNPVIVNPLRVTLGIHSMYLIVAASLVAGMLFLWRRNPQSL